MSFSTSSSPLPLFSPSPPLFSSFSPCPSLTTFSVSLSSSRSFLCRCSFAYLGHPKSVSDLPATVTCDSGKRTVVDIDVVLRIRPSYKPFSQTLAMASASLNRVDWGLGNYFRANHCRIRRISNRAFPPSFIWTLFPDFLPVSWAKSRLSLPRDCQEYEDIGRLFQKRKESVVNGLRVLLLCGLDRVQCWLSEGILI